MHTIAKNIRKGWAVLALFLEIAKLILRRRQLTETRTGAASIAWLWWQMGMCHLNAGQLKAAEFCAKQHVALSSDLSCGHALLALICFRQQKLTEALVEADRALTNNRNNWDAYQIKGKVLLGLGEWEEAARQFRQALWISDKDKHDGEVHALIASAYERLGRLEEAGKHWRRAIELNTDDD